MSEPTSNAPKLAGAKDADAEEEEKATKETLTDQVIHMDLETNLGVEVQPIQKDYENVTEQKQLIEQTKVNNDNTVQVNYSATQKKARRAVKKIKEAASLDGKAGAQGTPIPDYWDQLLKQNQLNHDQLIETLKDMRTFRGEAAPLQDQQTIPASLQQVIQEDPNRPQTMMTLQEKAAPAAIIIPAGEDTEPMEQESKRRRTFDQETESYSDRFKKVFHQHFNMENRKMRERVSQDQSMGQSYEPTPKGMIYF